MLVVPRIPLRVLRVALLVVAVFNALSAVGGSVVLFVGGLGIPAYYQGPFGSFVVPGLLLLLVVGGTQAWSAAALARRSPGAPLATAVAGLGMQIWIVVEVAIAQEFIALHAIYVASGTLQLVLLLGMLRVAPPLVSGAWTDRRPGRSTTPDRVTTPGR